MDNNERFPGNDIHPTAIIGPNVTIGTGNYIGPYCLIGMPGEHRVKWGDDKGVVIYNDCTFTGHVTIDSGIEGRTIIGNRVFIMKHAHVGHDASIYESVTISCGAKVGGHSTVREFSNIGLNAVLHQCILIHAYCMIAMGAVITTKCLTQPGYMYAGNPAVEKGRNKKAPNGLIDEEPCFESDCNKPGSYQSGPVKPMYHPYNKNIIFNESSSTDAQL